MPSDEWRADICCTCVVLIDIELVAKTGGIRVLLNVLAEGPLELAPLLTPVFLYIADSPRTRAYLHAGIDLEASGDAHLSHTEGLTWSGIYHRLHSPVSRTRTERIRTT